MQCGCQQEGGSDTRVCSGRSSARRRSLHPPRRECRRLLPCVSILSSLRFCLSMCASARLRALWHGVALVVRAGGSGGAAAPPAARYSSARAMGDGSSVAAEVRCGTAGLSL